MNLKRQKLSINNRKYSGGKKDTNYFTKKLKEFGLAVPKYLDKGIWRIGPRQNCIHDLFRYERLAPKMEEYYEHLRQKAQIDRAIAKQKMERYDNYLK